MLTSCGKAFDVGMTSRMSGKGVDRLWEVFDVKDDGQEASKWC